jgi:hypothetical protein
MASNDVFDINEYFISLLILASIEVIFEINHLNLLFGFLFLGFYSIKIARNQIFISKKLK